MFIGNEGRLLSLASTVCSMDGEDQSPMGGGSADPVSDDGGEAPAEEAAPVDEEPVEEALEGEPPEPAAAAPVVEEQQEAVDPAVMAELNRMFGGAPAQQQQAPDPLAALRPLLEPIVQQNQLLMQQQYAAQQQAQQARFEASRPKPPPPDAPAVDHLKFINDNLQWEQAQGMRSLESKIDALTKNYETQQQQAQQAWQQQQQTIQMQNMERAYATGIQKLASDPRAPHMKVYTNPDAAAALQTIHKALGDKMPLQQVAHLLAQAFGAAPKTAAAAAATRRTGETAALKSRRDQARQGGRPLPAAAGNGKAGSPPKGARENVMRAMKAGARFDRSLLESLGISNVN